MEAIAVPLRGPLCWGDFAWLDEPAPVPPDTVKEPPADPLLSGICEGVLISDRGQMALIDDSLRWDAQFQFFFCISVGSPVLEIMVLCSSFAFFFSFLFFASFLLFIHFS